MLLTIVAIAVAQVPTPAAVDISSWKADALAVTDGRGHYLVWRSADRKESVFYGDGKTMYHLYSPTSSSNEDAFNVTIWEPRLFHGDASFWRNHEGSFFVSCGKHNTTLTPVTGEALAKLVSSARFVGERFPRTAVALYRDDDGRYYYIDRLGTRDPEDRRDFRLYVGEKGKAKLQPLKDIVDDTRGMIFSTRNGQLRLITSDGEQVGRWLEGKVERKLIAVPIDEGRNRKMIFTELGVYDGVLFGTPCDDLM